MRTLHNVVNGGVVKVGMKFETSNMLFQLVSVTSDTIIGYSYDRGVNVSIPMEYAKYHLVRVYN